MKPPIFVPPPFMTQAVQTKVVRVIMIMLGNHNSQTPGNSSFATVGTLALFVVAVPFRSRVSGISTSLIYFLVCSHKISIVAYLEKI